MKSVARMHVAVLCALLAPATVYGIDSTPEPSPTASPPPFAYASPPGREQDVPADATWSTEVTPLLDASDYAGAINVLSAYVDDPSRTDADAMTMADAYNLLGYSYRSLTPPDMGNALASYQLALSKNPDHCGVYEYLGEMYLQQTDLPNAVAQLEELNTRCAGSMETQMLQDAITEYEAQQSLFDQGVPPSGAAPQQASVALMTLVVMVAMFA